MRCYLRRSATLALLCCAGCMPPLDRLPLGDRGRPESSAGVDRGVDPQPRDAAREPASCQGPGDCDDKLACTQDSCQAGVCRNAIVAGQCVIGGACVEQGRADPKDPCRRCDPSKAPRGWTQVACVTTLAGGSSFSSPEDVAVDASGRVYVADTKNNCIRMIEHGTITLVAGSGAAGHQDGTSANATFSAPGGLALVDGNVLVADTGSSLIRQISGGSVTTPAGNNLLPQEGYLEGPVVTAMFHHPSAVAAAAPGRLYVADTDNQRIRRVESGSVSLVAGNALKGFADGPLSLAQFSSPRDLVVDAAGKVYVADRGNNRIRVIAGNQVSTLAGQAAAGFADAAAGDAKFSSPSGLAIDAAGNLYVADTGNNRIRVVSPQGIVNTLAGTETAGLLNGAADEAQLKGPMGVAVEADGLKVYVADTGNHAIRLITR